MAIGEHSNHYASGHFIYIYRLKIGDITTEHLKNRMAVKTKENDVVLNIENSVQNIIILTNKKIIFSCHSEFDNSNHKAHFSDSYDIIYIYIHQYIYIYRKREREESQNISFFLSIYLSIKYRN